MQRLLPIALAALAFVPAPAAAQDAAGDKVNTVIIYGDDECPPSVGDEIVVCARMEEEERYRIPEALRESNDPENTAWINRVRSFETVGNFGPMSCSPAGAGGEIGCTAQEIEAAYQEKREGRDVRFGQLIAEAREERLATIDAEAADTQARVEVLEDEYMRRLEQERDAEEAAAPPASSTPRVVDPLAVPPSE